VKKYQSFGMGENIVVGETISSVNQHKIFLFETEREKMQNEKVKASIFHFFP
jgi:hypothetical protein